MNKVNKNKINNVSISLLKNKTIKQSLLDNGYSISTANNGADNKVVQEALAKIEREQAKKGYTAERLVEEGIWLYEHNKRQVDEAKTSKDRKDWISKTQASFDTLARHILSTKQDVKTEDITEKGQSILDRYTDIESVTIN